MSGLACIGNSYAADCCEPHQVGVHNILQETVAGNFGSHKIKQINSH